MFKRMIHGLFLLAFLTGLLATTPPAPATAQAASKGISPDALLNPDGTMKLEGSTSGALDLSGYSVQIDPKLGPVFTSLAAQNNWAAVGTNGGPFNDGINSVIVVGTDVYVGGWFTDAGGVPEADHIARWDGSQWLALSNGGVGNPALTSAVYSMVFTGGTLYVAGWFDTLNTSGSSIANAARFARWNGSVWSAVPGMTSTLNDNVQTLAYDPTNNIIYVGGGFTDVNGNTSADKVFGIDLDTSTLVVLGNNGASNGSLNDGVYALAVDSSGAVYAGGFFTNVMNGVTTLTEADYIAKWNGSAWSALGNNGAGVGALNALVVAITLDGSNNVYAGGSFTNAAGVSTADYIAKWNGSAWSALGSDGSGDGALLSTGNGSTVQDILINGTDVYASGYFIGSAGIPTADYLARFDTLGGTWSGLGSNGSGDGALNGGGTAMALSAGKLYVVGIFYDVSNGGTVLPVADHFAFWDGTDWATYGDPNGVFKWGVHAMAVMGTDVYVGGDFSDAGGDPRIDYIARWDGARWNPVGNLTQTYGSISGNVLALVVDGTDLYIGGGFAFVYNEGVTVANSNYIVKWDGANFSTVGDGLNNTVETLAVDASHNLYVGGLFTNAGSIGEADYIAKWNGSAWSALAGNGSGNGALNALVRTLAVSGTDLYIGGNFTSVVNTSNVGIVNTAYLAKWNGSAWSAMDGLTQPVSSFVLAINVSGGDVYVGGYFNNLNGIAAADRIAKWNGSAWSALGDNGLGDGSLNNFVTSIAVNGSQVYAGGGFTDPGNPDTITLGAGDYIAKWNGTAWSALGNNGGVNGSLNDIVQSLMIAGNDVWVGGDFQNVNNYGTVVKEADHLAVYGLDLAPGVVSIVRANPSPTSSTSVGFTVTFSEPVLNVDKNDFALTVTGLTGVSISAVTGASATRTVTVKTGTGIGTIRLNIPNTATITDTTGNSLGGLPYLGGQVYSVKKRLTFFSSGTQDGWVLESGMNTSAGGSMDSASTTLRIGDDAVASQYRSILSFSTASLPDTSVITKVTLKVRKVSVSGGGNPVSIFQGFLADIRKGTIGTAALQLTDWQTSISKTVGPFNLAPVGGWYVFNLTTSKSYINKLAPGGGLTQIRLRFSLEDNGDTIANLLSLYSGNAPLASRPQLIVEYYLP